MFLVDIRSNIACVKNILIISNTFYIYCYIIVLYILNYNINNTITYSFVLYT